VRTPSRPPPANMTAPAASEVLIVGVGPTGLVLALWLKRLGAHCRRRDTLIAALHKHRPRLRLHGVAAGLHLMIELTREVDERGVLDAAGRRSIRIYGASAYSAKLVTAPPGLVLGYGGLPEERIDEAVRELIAALAECSPRAVRPLAHRRHITNSLCKPAAATAERRSPRRLSPSERPGGAWSRESSMAAAGRRAAVPRLEARGRPAFAWSAAPERTSAEARPVTYTSCAPGSRRRRSAWPH
jgi:hypothetical protein